MEPERGGRHSFSSPPLLRHSPWPMSRAGGSFSSRGRSRGLSPALKAHSSVSYPQFRVKASRWPLPAR